MTITQSTMIGWIKTAKKHYTHDSGAQVRYNCNRRLWEVIGGKNDGHHYERMWVAMDAAAKTPCEWIRR